MVLIEPNEAHDLRVMRDWCRDSFGPSNTTTWGIIQPEFTYMFIREEWATAFMLKFGGKII